MSDTRLHTVGLLGVNGRLVQIQARALPGFPTLTVSGFLGHTAGELRDRVRAAVCNSGYLWPDQRITVDLLPPATRTSAASLDLAVACAVLAASGHLPRSALHDTAIIGELGLDGSVRPVRGVLPMVLGAARAAVRSVIVPAGNAAEAALAPGVTVRATDSLRRLVEYAHRRQPLLDPPAPDGSSPGRPATAPPVEPAAGCPAVQAAAAGGHHLAIYDLPGIGPTRLARTLVSILPDLDEPAALEVTSLHSLAGTLPDRPRLQHRPPLQVPHHRISVAALLGGGFPWQPRPGVVSLAHHGVLLLDPAPKFGPRVLEALRQPLEQAEVVLHKAGKQIRLPAQVQLVLAATPCPCPPPAGDTCRCSPLVRRRWLGRLAGPVLDRIDIHLHLAPAAARPGHPPASDQPQQVAARVATARAAARDRWAAYGIQLNAQIPAAVLRQARWLPPAPAVAPLRRLLHAGAISARGHDTVLRLAWTLADLAGRTHPNRGDIEDACALRAGR
jgi:magnesium chelatase family protein